MSDEYKYGPPLVERGTLMSEAVKALTDIENASLRPAYLDLLTLIHSPAARHRAIESLVVTGILSAAEARELLATRGGDDE